MSIPNNCDPFIMGANYSWSEFYSDLGGYAAFATQGVATRQAELEAAFCDMKQNGCVDVVRFWLYPDLASDGLTHTGNCIDSVGGTTQADICAISAAAAACGVKIMWTYFSFDGFKPYEDKGLPDFRPTLTDSVIDANCRADMMQNLVGPITQMIVNCPDYAATYHSTDLFNEPDWVIDDANPAFPSQPFTDFDTECEGPRTFDEMYQFLSDMADTVRANDPNACITIGTAAKKWASAWEPLVDFNSPHSYAFDQAFFPADQPFSNWGLSKPTLIGEYPPVGYAAGGFPGAVAGSLPKTHPQWLMELCQSGYSGAFAWAYTVDQDNPTNGGYTAATIAEQNTFATEQVKKVDRLEIAPSNVECGESAIVSIKSLNACGTHVSSNISVATGTLTNTTFDPVNCCYVGTYTAPACPANTSVTFSATDEDGNNASGHISVGNVVTGPDCIDGSPISVVVGSEAEEGCTVISCGSCSCVPTRPIFISDVEWPCAPLGAFLQWRIEGCDCGCDDPAKQCGGLGCYISYLPSGLSLSDITLVNGILTIRKMSKNMPGLFFYCKDCADNDCDCPTIVVGNTPDCPCPTLAEIRQIASEQTQFEINSITGELQQAAAAKLLGG